MLFADLSGLYSGIIIMSKCKVQRFSKSMTIFPFSASLAHSTHVLRLCVHGRLISRKYDFVTYCVCQIACQIHLSCFYVSTWDTYRAIYRISRGLSSLVVGICLQMLYWSSLLEDWPVLVNNKFVGKQKFSNLPTKLICEAVFTLNLSYYVCFPDFPGFSRLWG